MSRNLRGGANKGFSFALGGNAGFGGGSDSDADKEDRVEKSK